MIPLVTANSPASAKRENEGPRAMSLFYFIASLTFSQLRSVFPKGEFAGILGQIILRCAEITHCYLEQHLACSLHVALWPPPTPMPITWTFPSPR